MRMIELKVLALMVLVSVRVWGQTNIKDENNATTPINVKEGKVGIGTTIPLETLDVNGIIANNNLSVWKSNGLNRCVEHHWRENSYSTTVFYKKIAYLSSNSGEVRVVGLLGGHTPGQGKSTIDITFNARDSFKAIGHIDGKSPNARIILVQNGTGSFGTNYDVYLYAGQYASIDVHVYTVGNSSGCNANYGSWHSTTPGTFFWDTNNQANLDYRKTTFINDLNVNGAIRAEEILVEAQTADFVFEDTYRLRELSEVESFIKANKHLPEIPSAAQMEEQGVNLAEMNKLLLQKVEELTLYAIQQEEARNKEQGEREKLEEEVSSIKIELNTIKELITNNKSK